MTTKITIDSTSYAGEDDEFVLLISLSGFADKGQVVRMQDHIHHFFLERFSGKDIERAPGQQVDSK